VISIRAGAATDSGQVRDHNEDSVFAGSGLYAVADGIGGHAAGEVASAMAVARLERLGGLPDLNPEAVRAHLALANQEILDSAARHPEQSGMGTTVAGMALARFAGTDHWVVFNVGDCRVYRFTGDVLDQLTVDHTEVAELIAAGTIGPEQAQTHPRRNVVTRALGTDPAPEVDLWILPPTPGERFLICSDGLPLELTDAQITQVLREQSDSYDAARMLVRLAVEAGGRDNVSAVVVDTLPDQESASVDDTAPRVHTGPAAGARR
jgi:PPM family protein phosphatase